MTQVVDAVIYETNVHEGERVEPMGKEMDSQVHRAFDGAATRGCGMQSSL